MSTGIFFFSQKKGGLGEKPFMKEIQVLETEKGKPS